MDFFTALDIGTSGLIAQRLRMNVISSNIANINTTRTPQGGPYVRRDVVFKAEPILDFQETLNDCMNEPIISKVKVEKVVEDRRRPFIYKYDPTHPDADKNGYVAYPNINIVEEMTNLILSQRSFEANVSAIRVTKEMIRKAIEIGRY